MGASIFIADNGQKKYVVKLFDHLADDQTKNLLLYQKTASIGGYGPHVYFEDVNQGNIIMDYLLPETPNSETLHKDLSILLKEIHTGPSLEFRGHIPYLDYLSSLQPTL